MAKRLFFVVGERDHRLRRTAGVRDEAIVDAIQICAQFNIIDRLADSFAFELLSDEANRRAGAFLLRFGYR